MLEHDQNQVPTEEQEDNLTEAEDTSSKPIVDASETEAEPTAEELTVVEQTQEEPVAEPEPELPAEEPAMPEPEAPVASEPEPEPVLVEEPVVAEEAPAEKPKRKPSRPAQPAEPVDEAHQEMLDMIDEYTSSFHRGEIKEGTVVNVNDKEVVVAIGFKSDGVIPRSEFEFTGVPELNSKIMVFINELDNGEGRLSLSKRRADYVKNIELIKKAHAEDGLLTGIIRRRVKGGMIVNVLGIEAFLPGSQMSLKPIPNLDQFIGKEMTFKVVNIDEEHRNIILSRKLVLEEEASSKREELLGKIQVDSELDGEVKNITQYGAFIDLGGIDGLLHLTDMSWGKINHPSDMLSIGDKVKVKVIKFDSETNKISLGLKQLVPHPWETIEMKFPEGVRITGKVVSVKSFGAFVEIEPGVEGLVHISEMSWTKKITDARKIVKIGDVVNAIVLELDKENKRISLGMKQMEANPWLSIEDHYPIGTVLTRPVKSLTAFGAFVEIEDGIDGLIHISDISWTKRIYHPREIYRKGQEVESVILSIDRALHRIALGVKQLSPDPWENLNMVLPINTEVKGKISKLIPKGVLVDVVAGENVVEGFIPISHLAIPNLEHSEDAFHVGEEIPLKVIELDMDNRRLILSVKAFFFSRDPKLQEEYIALHEQYIRDRITRLQKKKAERAPKEKTAENAVPGEEHPGETPLEEAVIQEDVLEEAVAEEAVAEEPVVEAIAEEAVIEEPVVEEIVEEAIIEEPVVEEIVEEAIIEEPVVEEIVEEAVVEIPEEVVVETTTTEEVTEESPEVTEEEKPEVE